MVKGISFYFVTHSLLTQ